MSSFRSLPRHDRHLPSLPSPTELNGESPPSFILFALGGSNPIISTPFAIDRIDFWQLARKWWSNSHEGARSHFKRGESQMMPFTITTAMTSQSFEGNLNSINQDCMRIEGKRGSVKSYQADHRGGKEGNFLPNFLHSRLIKPFLSPPKNFPLPFPPFVKRNLVGRARVSAFRCSL